MPQLPQHIFGQNAAAGEFGSLSHQLEKCVFSLPTDDSGVAEIDDKFATLKVLAGTDPGFSQFLEPRLNQFSFNNQAAPRSCVDGGKFQHLPWFDVLDEGNARAKLPARADHLQLIVTQRFREKLAKGGVENCRCQCRHVSTEVARGLTPELNDAAMDAVKRWTFVPASRDGKPVATQIAIEVTFKVR
jgi:hypothetical protein